MNARMELVEALQRVQCDYLNLSLVTSSSLFDVVIVQAKISPIKIWVDYVVASEYPEETYRYLVDQVIEQFDSLKKDAGFGKEIQELLLVMLDLLIKLGKMSDRIGFYR
jgi:hypothetical protein